METKSFFGENGLTSTSANHYCNLAKEMARKVQNYLENVRFYNTDIRIIGEDTKTIISEGINTEAFDDIEKSIQTIAKCNSLIAFFREAIKEKDRLAAEAKMWEDVDRRAELNNRMTKHLEIKPERGVYMDAEAVIHTWSVGEQERFLSLQAEAAAYGKLIHEDGRLSRARRDLMNVQSNPNSVNENGRDTIIYTYTPTADVEDVDDLFFDLQNHYREVQAELNGMLKRIDDTIRGHALKVDDEFRHNLVAWTNAKRALDSELEVIIADENIERKKKADEVQKLKIVVPNRLKGIFEQLQKLG